MFTGLKVSSIDYYLKKIYNFDLRLEFRCLSDVFVLVCQDMCEESCHLLLTWCGELLAQSRPYFTTLASTSEMTSLVNTLCTLVAESLSSPVLLLACANLEQLLIAPYTLYWNVKWNMSFINFLQPILVFGAFCSFWANNENPKSNWVYYP